MVTCPSPAQGTSLGEGEVSLCLTLAETSKDAGRTA